MLPLVYPCLTSPWIKRAVPSVNMGDLSQDGDIVQTIEKKGGEEHTETIEHVREVNEVLTRTDSHLDNVHVHLGWRSWLVVLVTMFG